MRAIKISPSSRAKQLAADRPATAFIKWNSERSRYEGIVEVYNSATGEKFQFAAGQVEWMDLHREMMERFAKDAKA